MKKIYFYKIVIEAINEQDNISVQTLSNRLKISERQIREIVRDYNRVNSDNKISCRSNKFKFIRKLTKNEIDDLVVESNINQHLSIIVNILIKSLIEKITVPNEIEYKSTFLSFKSLDITLDFFGLPKIRDLVKLDNNNKKYLICLMYSYFNVLLDEDYNDELYNSYIWNVSDKYLFEKYISESKENTYRLFEILGRNHFNSMSFNVIFNYFLLENILNNDVNIEYKVVHLNGLPFKLNKNFDKELLKSIIILEVECIELYVNNNVELVNTFETIESYLSFKPKYGLKSHFLYNIVKDNIYDYYILNKQYDLTTYFNFKLAIILIGNLRINNLSFKKTFIEYKSKNSIEVEKYELLCRGDFDHRGIYIAKTNQDSIEFTSDKIYIEYRTYENLKQLSRYVSYNNINTLSYKHRTINIILYTPISHMYRLINTLAIEYPNINFVYVSNLQKKQFDKEYYSVNPYDEYKTFKEKDRVYIIL